MTLQQALDLGVQHHQSGQLREAEAIYRQVLSVDPNNPHALHLLGQLSNQVGQGQAALNYIQRAIAQNPTSAQYQASLGAALVTLGRMTEAIDVFQRALLLEPGLLDAHANLGLALAKIGKLERAVESLQAAARLAPDNFRILDSLASALSQAGRHEQAIDILKKALDIRADFAPTHLTLGNALRKLNRGDEAISAYRAALSMRPDFPEALRNLSSLLCDRAAVDEAIDLARRALALQPDSAPAWFNLGRILHRQQRLEEAADALRRAVSFDSRFAQAYAELGGVLRKIGKLDEAIDALNRSLEIESSARANYHLGLALLEQGKRREALAACLKARTLGLNDHEFLNTLGVIHQQMGRIDEAVDFFSQSLAAKEDFAVARWNLGLLQLLKGQFREGWIGYDARWKANIAPMPVRYSQNNLWDGRDLKNLRILLDCEQGFGDCIQFVRYIPLIAQRGGKPILAAFAELRRLFGTVPCLEEIIVPPQSIPRFDVQCPLGSLPRLFDTTLDTIPANIPYLFADAALAERWRSRVPADGRIKIGLAWSGKADFKHNADRSPGLSALSPLAAVPNTWFCSLQKGAAAVEAIAPPGFPITDWTAELQDFADTAALIANLDLVICSDTAVAHLAGAMGKPLWLLLSASPDWRWLLDRKDSPWYPTMKIFRQASAGDWKKPVSKIAEALKQFR